MPAHDPPGLIQARHQGDFGRRQFAIKHMQIIHRSIAKASVSEALADGQVRFSTPDDGPGQVIPHCFAFDPDTVDIQADAIRPSRAIVRDPKVSPCADFYGVYCAHPHSIARPEVNQ